MSRLSSFALVNSQTFTNVSSLAEANIDLTGWHTRAETYLLWAYNSQTVRPVSHLISLIMPLAYPTTNKFCALRSTSTVSAGYSTPKSRTHSHSFPFFNFSMSVAPLPVTAHSVLLTGSELIQMMEFSVSLF